MNKALIVSLICCILGVYKNSPLRVGSTVTGLTDHNKMSIATATSKIANQRYTSAAKKFSQTYLSTTLYQHTCKFTGKSFLSPIRRLTYSPEGERLKELTRTAAKEATPVFFGMCPVTGKAFRKINPRDRNSLEGEAILIQGKKCGNCGELKPVEEFGLKTSSTKRRSSCKLCIAEKSKKYRQTAEGKASWAKRNKTDGVKSYRQTYYRTNKDKMNAQREASRIAQKERKRETTPESCKVFFVTCQETGTLFTAKTANAQVCKEGAAIRANRKYQATLSELKSTRKAYSCRVCNKPFEVNYGDKTRSYCSDKCRAKQQRKDRKDFKTPRSRALFYGCKYERVNISKVFERDDWTCRLCGIKTPQSLRGTLNPNAPELDHIIPMSKQGPHTYDNVQCTCRRCNGKKGNKQIGQMPLFV